MIIISSLNNKANNYVSSSNYHKKTTNFNGDNLMIIDTYYKDGKTVTFLRRVTEKEINKILKKSIKLDFLLCNRKLE